MFRLPKTGRRPCRAERPRSESAGRRLWTGLVLCLLLGSQLACGGHPVPRAPGLAERSDRLPVIFVPGITGSVLREGSAGEPAWGTGGNLLRPRDGGYRVALSLVRPEEDPLRATEVLRRVRLAGVVKPVYGPILELLRRNGYRLGSLDHPERPADLFPFPYDWRRDNVETAARLHQRLVALATARGRERLPIVLICQSNGAHICRYVAKYGGLDLDAAERGDAGPPTSFEVRRMILVGTSNGGSLRILRELDRGRRYVPVIGRKLQPETLYTFPALFQDLPAYRDDLFLDARGRPLELDLYRAATWEEQGWSIFHPDAARRADRRPDLFGDLERRRDYLVRVLDRARRLQRLLRRSVEGAGPTHLSLIQGAYTETPDRAVVAPPGSRRGLWFSGDRELRRGRYLQALASAPGDGHATLASQLWLSDRERRALDGATYHLPGGHFEMILDPGTQRHLVDLLARTEEGR